MKVEEIIQAVEELTPEEKTRLIAELMPRLCQAVMSNPELMQQMISMCWDILQDPTATKNIPHGMRQMMERMMRGKT